MYCSSILDIDLIGDMLYIYIFLMFYRRYAAEAAERAKILEEFMQRKREAVLNKQRGLNDVYGVSASTLCSTYLVRTSVVSVGYQMINI